MFDLIGEDKLATIGESDDYIGKETYLPVKKLRNMMKK